MLTCCGACRTWRWCRSSKAACSHQGGDEFLVAPDGLQDVEGPGVVLGENIAGGKQGVRIAAHREVVLRLAQVKRLQVFESDPGVHDDDVGVGQKHQILPGQLTPQQPDLRPGGGTGWVENLVSRDHELAAMPPAIALFGPQARFHRRTVGFTGSQGDERDPHRRCVS